MEVRTAALSPIEPPWEIATAERYGRPRRMDGVRDPRYIGAMPELPEVEYAATVARSVAEGRTITRVRTLHPAQRRALPPRAARSLAGDRVLGVERRGKTQRFRLQSGRRLDVHFRMTGDWVVRQPGGPLPAYARAELTFDDGASLVLDDPRALSVVTLHPAGEPPDDDLGPEPTDRAFDARWLGAALASRRVSIKQALLDQRVVAGLGNIYAAEALWHARIDPRTPANRLGPPRVKRLVTGIRAVIRRAIRQAARYTGAERESPARFAVYDREGLPCRRCGTAIRRIVQGGRSTYFCPRCQR